MLQMCVSEAQLSASLKTEMVSIVAGDCFDSSSCGGSNILLVHVATLLQETGEGV